IRKENDDALKTLKDEFAKKGGRIVEWDPKERANFEETGRKVSESFAGDGEGKLFSKALLDEVLATIAAERAKAPAAAPGRALVRHPPPARARPPAKGRRARGRPGRAARLGRAQLRPGRAPERARRAPPAGAVVPDRRPAPRPLGRDARRV